MGDRVKDEAGFISDPALAVLLCSNRAWRAQASGTAMVYIAPADERGEFWHYAKADVEAGTLDASERPVSRKGLASFTEQLGIHGGLDWQPEGRIKRTARPNPIVTMFGECC